MKIDKIKKEISQLKKLFIQFFPQDKQEYILLLLFFVFYSAYSIYIGLTTNLIDHKIIVFDTYFSFDNPTVYKNGYSYIQGHPFMRNITRPIMLFGNMLALVFSGKAKTVFLVMMCTLCISLSVLYINRYLKDVLEINKYPLLLFTLFFGFTFTNLILSFTIDSFTITSFLLTFTIYYYSIHIKRNKDIGIIPATILAFSLGGITITNFAKGVIPIFFLNRKKAILIKRIIIIGVVFGILILYIRFNFFSEINRYVDLYGHTTTSSYFNFSNIFDRFFSAPIFYSDTITTYTNNLFGDGLKYQVIDLNYYHYWWQYLFMFFLTSQIVISIFLNYKKDLFVLILSLIAIDFFIHIIYKYGLKDPFIYGGHWVYCIPIFLGFLYKSLPKKYIIPMLTLNTFLFITLLINNGFHLYKFINISQILYPY